MILPLEDYLCNTLIKYVGCWLTLKGNDFLAFANTVHKSTLNSPSTTESETAFSAALGRDNTSGREFLFVSVIFLHFSTWHACADHSHRCRSISAGDDQRQELCFPPLASPGLARVMPPAGQASGKTRRERRQFVSKQAQDSAPPNCHGAGARASHRAWSIASSTPLVSNY